MTKKEAKYTDFASMPSERCKLCKYFIEGGACKKVEGLIKPGGWCRLFEHK